MSRQPGTTDDFAHSEHRVQERWADTVHGRAFDFRWNLLPQATEAMLDYFSVHGNQWHRFRSHVRSSQVCCVNCLFPLGDNPEALLAVFRAVVPDAVEVLAIDEIAPRRLLTFEYIGKQDYLGESRPGRRRQRGANCTSADAAVLLKTSHGESVEVLLEWKYTEEYSDRRPDADGHPVKDRSDAKRLATYESSVWRRHWNPVDSSRTSLDSLLVEPLYQLFRQQSMAAAMEQTDQGWTREADRVVCLHLSPAGNRQLHAVTSPPLKRLGTDVFAVWSALLRSPDRFVSMTTNDFFAPLRSQSLYPPAI